MTMTETEEREWVCGHFDRMMAAPSPAERTAYLLRHPVLLSSGALRLIQAGRSAEPGLRATMLYLDEARAHFWQHPEDYPKGHGPLEALVDELRAGSVDFAEALQRAREPGCSGQLSHSYLRAVLLHWVEELDIDVAFAMHAAELALEAAWAMPLPHLVLDVRRAAAEGFIRRELRKELDLRYIPALTFEYDTSFDHSIRIHTILKKIQVSQPENDE